ncbi:hypothetical protein [Pedobacter nyackensis]|uniref:Uncharacterized protein n=1 Tax=Pedobacter nyackensis TaxID=475255 RepID=A0A1W1ZY73_9SPHI|nr:hypothetical protein [Pedobacter nyackensis]SMC53008.1 hypothetical protein SAMN04488101_101121 [Pedobacter nyackensis]
MMTRNGFYQLAHSVKVVDHHNHPNQFNQTLKKNKQREMKTNPNDPIQPILTQSASLQNETSLGLTKREHFAATLPNNFESLPLHIQETICGESAPFYELEDMEGGKDSIQTYGEPYVAWLLKGKSKYAVMNSDALIESLNKEEQ